MRINAAIPQDVETVIQAGMAYQSFRYVDANGGSSSLDFAGQTALYEAAVGRIAKLADFDIIHAHDWMTFRAALYAKAVSGKPLVVHIHTVEADRAGQEFGGNPLCREIEATALELADHVIAISERTKQGIIREYGIPADKIQVVHNHFDPHSDLNYLASLEHPGSNEYVYLSRMRELGYGIVTNIGRMTIQKGLPYLLRAFKIVHEKVPKSLLLLAGAGEQRDELIGMAADLGIGDSVVFTGFQRGKRYADTFKVGDVFVMPSFSEPFGLTALESVFYGTPVAISRQSGATEVVHHCLKADYWDVNAFANNITALLQHKPLGEELRANALKEVLSRSWHDSAVTLWGVYDHHVRKQKAYA
jgi:glycosyltransferase involved in cell wall biosynthesis